MPLIQSKSKKALKENIETEMKANPSKKDRAQNLAIAYNVKRKNAAKKMAQGGPVSEKTEIIRPDKGFGAIIGVGRAEGGMIESEIDDAASIAAAIMAKRRKASESADSESDIDSQMMMAEGGMADVNENNMEQPNEYYKQNREALDWDMDDDQLDAQPMDSNEHSDSEEIMKENYNDASVVGAIRRKMKTKSPIVR